MELRVGMRIQRTGHHLYLGHDYDNGECSLGDRGTITDINDHTRYGTNLGVEWDADVVARHGCDHSRIDAICVTVVDPGPPVIQGW